MVALREGEGIELEKTRQSFEIDAEARAPSAELLQVLKVTCYLTRCWLGGLHFPFAAWIDVLYCNTTFPGLAEPAVPRTPFAVS